MNDKLLNLIFSKADETLLEKKAVSIAIDGDCCSGKSTLCELLCERYSCDAVHMDDFFLPPKLRSEERLGEPGGNFHRERFSEEVLPYIGKNKDFSYGVFDCGKMEITREQLIKASPVFITEGSYSLYPDFAPAYDLKIFLSVSKDIQIERIRERDGEESLENFISKWIPFEKKYHNAFNIPQLCDIVFCND